jgi:hypothetical protein
MRVPFRSCAAWMSAGQGKGLLEAARQQRAHSAGFRHNRQVIGVPIARITVSAGCRQRPDWPGHSIGSMTASASSAATRSARDCLPDVGVFQPRVDLLPGEDHPVAEIRG